MRDDDQIKEVPWGQVCLAALRSIALGTLFGAPIVWLLTENVQAAQAVVARPTEHPPDLCQQRRPAPFSRVPFALLPAQTLLGLHGHGCRKRINGYAQTHAGRAEVGTGQTMDLGGDVDVARQSCAMWTAWHAGCLWRDVRQDILVRKDSDPRAAPLRDLLQIIRKSGFSEGQWRNGKDLRWDIAAEPPVT